MNVVGISGSLRAGSLNHALVGATLAQLPAGITSGTWDRLADLPLYNEDLEHDLPAVVAELRATIETADALVLATPEYNGSVSAALKNVIDWASRPRGAAALAGKPVLVLAASPSPRGAEWAREDLVRILTVAGANVVGDHVGIGSAFDPFTDGALVDAAHTARLADLVGALDLTPHAA